MRKPVLMLFLVVAGLIAAGAILGASAQNIPKPDIKKIPFPDKIAIDSFTVQPAQPVVGQTTTIILKLHNITKKPMSVAWKIITNNDIKWHGTAEFHLISNDPTPDGPPGEQFMEIRNTYIAIGGQRDFYAVVDATNALGEGAGWDKDNKKSLSFLEVVSAVSTSAPVQMATRAISYDLARQAGAGFVKTKEGKNPPAKLIDNETYNPTTAQFGIDCRTSLGERANFELFKNFNLTNGWTVQSFEVDLPFSNGPNFGCRIDTPPSAGSTSPLTKLHFWANPSFSDSRLIRIFITGPADKDPYR